MKKSNHKIRLKQLVAASSMNVGPLLLRGGLKAASWLYGLGVEFRNSMFDTGILPVRRVDANVISIGNLTVGGTGKTPLVEWVCRWLKNRGYSPAVLSRGYGQKSVAIPEGADPSLPAGVNDEGLLLQANLSEVHLAFGPDRYECARVALQALHPAPDCFVMDDGFQHRRLHRDLNIVLVDATCPFGYGQMLPRGLLREPYEALARADLVIISRADQVAEETLSELKERVQRLALDAPVLTCVHELQEVLQCKDSSPVGRGWLKEKRALCFCGLGNPEGFRRTVEALPLNLTAFHAFPDHHWYSRAEIQFLEEEARRLEVDILLTTQKDAVKFDHVPFRSLPFLCLRIGIAFREGEEILEEHLARLFPEKAPALGRMSREELEMSVSLGERPEEPVRPWEECWWEEQVANRARRP